MIKTSGHYVTCLCYVNDKNIIISGEGYKTKDVNINVIINIEVKTNEKDYKNIINYYINNNYYDNTSSYQYTV